MGGVLLNIDYHKTRDAFINLGVTNFNDFYSQTHADPLFAELERGLVEPGEFYKLFQQQSGELLDNTAIDTAWNAMLGTYREKSLAYIEELKTAYNVYLLSNCNVIHYGALLKIHAQQFGSRLFDQRFHKAYYSFNLHQRKPDATAYTMVLEENNLVPGETLFIDDTYKNLPPAQSLGMQVLYIEPGKKTVEEALEALLTGS